MICLFFTWHLSIHCVCVGEFCKELLESKKVAWHTHTPTKKSQRHFLSKNCHTGCVLTLLLFIRRERCRRGTGRLTCTQVLPDIYYLPKRGASNNNFPWQELAFSSTQIQINSFYERSYSFSILDVITILYVLLCETPLKFYPLTAVAV